MRLNGLNLVTTNLYCGLTYYFYFVLVNDAWERVNCDLTPLAQRLWSTCVPVSKKRSKHLHLPICPKEMVVFKCIQASPTAMFLIKLLLNYV